MYSIRHACVQPTSHKEIPVTRPCDLQIVVEVAHHHQVAWAPQKHQEAWDSCGNLGASDPRLGVQSAIVDVKAVGDVPTTTGEACADPIPPYSTHLVGMPAFLLWMGTSVCHSELTCGILGL